MIIALFPNEKKKHSFELATHIKTYLEERGISVVVEDEKAQQIGAKPLSEAKGKIDFLICMGGDGTLLRIVHHYHHLNAPILGVNLGHLGFMADIPASDIYPSLDDLLKGDYLIDERLVIEAVTEGVSPLHAVNDIVIHRAKNYSLIELAIQVDGNYFNTFVADGVIIATPNGSTAYSLSAGGPILSPYLDALVITPICPHTISNRPIVLPSTSKIEIQYLSDYSPIDVRSDGLNAFSLSKDEVLEVKKSERIFKLVNLHRHEYFSTLRTKLSWSGKLWYS